MIDDVRPLAVACGGGEDQRSAFTLPIFAEYDWHDRGRTEAMAAQSFAVERVADVFEPPKENAFASSEASADSVQMSSYFGNSSTGLMEPSGIIPVSFATSRS